MYRSGPPPDAASVSNLLKSWLNGTSRTLTVRPALADLTLATILSNAVFSALPEAPYASQIVIVPDSAAALGLAPSDAAPEADGAAADGAGAWVAAPLEQALINSNAAATSGAKRSFFMAIACLLLVAG